MVKMIRKGNNMKKIILDCDPGMDDSMAIVMAVVRCTGDYHSKWKLPSRCDQHKCTESVGTIRQNRYTGSKGNGKPNDSKISK